MLGDLLWFGVWIVLLGIVLCVFVFLRASFLHYTWVQLRPNVSYVLHDRRYTFPQLQCPTYLFLLSSLFVSETRALFTRAVDLLGGIPWCASGKTLLGLHVHQSVPLPYDDGPLQIAILAPHHKELFHSRFAKRAAALGLSVRYRSRCNEHGGTMCAQRGIVRLSFLDQDAYLDLVVWHVEDDVVRVVTWYDHGNNMSFDHRIVFQTRSTLPLELVTRDGLDVMLPSHPEHVVVQTFGKEALTHAHTRWSYVHRALRHDNHVFQDMISM